MESGHPPHTKQSMILRQIQNHNGFWGREAMQGSGSGDFMPTLALLFPSVLRKVRGKRENRITGVNSPAATGFLGSRTRTVIMEAGFVVGGD